MSKYIPIGDVCYVYDGPHATPTKTEDGPIYLGIDAITPDCRLNPAEYAHLSLEDFPLWTKRVTPKKDDIVFSYEATLGRYAMIPEGFHGCLGRRLAIVRTKDDRINPKWLYYYFLSPEWCAFIANHTVRGSTVDRISVDDFPRYPIPDIDRNTQDLIVSNIQAVDQKIDLNNSICAELESMAKMLYDYWFVQFDFPDANGKPYRASGGEMVWNEQLKREIPKGWEIASINAMTTSYRGVSYDKNDLLPSSENGVLVLRGNNIQNNRLVYDRNVAYVPHSFVSKEQQIRAHDIILTMSSGSKEHIGKCTRFQYDSPHTYGAFLTKFTPDTDKVGFVYLSMISEFFKKKIKAICNGTGINNLTNETFDNLVFPNPTASVLKQFEKTVAPILEKMGSCEKENETLISLRDWLLPMLMNGQATIARAEPAPKLQVLQPEKPTRDPRFDRWLQTQGVAARGTVDEQTLHDIFDAMDDDDKQ